MSMSRKTIACFSIVVFLLSFDSCIRINKTAQTDPAGLYGSEPLKLTVVAVQTKTGERLEFSKKDRATISDNAVLVPDPEGTVPSRIAWNEIKTFKKNSSAELIYAETKDGRAFRVLSSGTYEAGILILRGLAYRSIPLSDVDLIWVRKVNKGASFAANAVVTLAVVAAASLAVIANAFKNWNPWEGAESCPFVYSYDGEAYVLDAEPYGGAVCAGLERVDWVGLDSLEPVGGRYRILLSNELEEVEHVDELKLVVVDHPEDVTVVPELSGRMRTIVSPQRPTSARDADGRDILALLAAKDDTFWLGRVEGRDPEKDENLKEELVLEFAKPAGAKSAKLVANAWWTQWGTQAVKPILATQGRELAAFIDRVDSGGPTLLSLLRWFASEEMYNLQVRVETESGWKTKALIFGGGPMIAKDKAYALDLSEVPGDTVRMKLTPAAGFWMIDRLALDFSEDATVRVTELAAGPARDAAGRDIGAELASDDGAYFVIPRGIGPATLEFAVPAQAPGTARTLFVKAAGYYDLMLDGEGERTLDLDELMRSPGETIRLALRSHPAISRPSPSR
jgi:hypothetical protein